MDNARILVTGAKGQLGVDLVRVLQERGYEVFGYGRDELDFTDPEAVESIFAKVRPYAVIHSGAYTKVDLAESEREAANRVNGYGSHLLADAAVKTGAKLVYMSTDYVFNGEAREPIEETRKPDPVNAYGRSKWIGEELIRSTMTRYFIVRTSWVYGLHGPNFVKTMLNLARQGKPLTVVDDQVGSPSYTIDLANCVAELIETEHYGVYHVSNSGACSWYEFAKAIFEIAGLEVEIKPVSSADFVRPAKRPAYSVLAHRALKENGFPEIRPWRDALQGFLFEELRIQENLHQTNP